MAYEVDQYTVSLLHFEDGIKDETGKVWSIKNNGVAITGTQAKVGNASAYFSAVGGIFADATDDVAFNTGDFTIDFWLYLLGGNYNPSYGNVITFFDSRSAPGTEPIAIFFNSNDSIIFNVPNKSITSSANVIIKNQWVHIACVRNNGIGTIFVNGKSVGSGDLSSVISKFPLYVGGDGNPRNSTGAMRGYLDEFRISNIARWTEDFTPPGTVVAPNAPTQLTATPGDSQVTLNWAAVTGATGYNVKRSTTAGGPYETIATSVSGASYVDTNVVNGTTYYYVVTTINADGESANSNEASATPQAAPVEEGQGLLLITLLDSSEREYKLPISKINKFIQWINQTTNIDNNCYTFDNIIDGSKEYLLYEKIISFKVMPLSAE
jgi:hypothetical protein